METPDALLAALHSGHGWRPAKAARWLGFLAHHLDVSGRQELEWWRLPDAVQRGRWASTATRPPGDNMRPCRLDLRMRGRGMQLLKSLRWSFAGMGVIVLPVVVLEVLKSLVPELAGENASKVPSLFGVLAIIIGVAMTGVGLVLGLMRWSQVPQAIPVPGPPAASFKRDLRMSVGQWLIFGLVLWVVGGLALGIVVAVDEDEPLMVFAGLMVMGPICFAVGVLFGVMLFLFGITASGRYYAAVRHLALRGRVPWRLMRFLGDACQVGLLREHGAGFRFARPELQAHFASRWVG